MGCPRCGHSWKSATRTHKGRYFVCKRCGYVTDYHSAIYRMLGLTPWRRLMAWVVSPIGKLLLRYRIRKVQRRIEAERKRFHLDPQTGRKHS
jgi:hypothetical protein